MTSPWVVCNENSLNLKNNNITSSSVQEEKIVFGFEDNFQPSIQEALPDSKEYLENLEQKLRKLKNNTSILKQLQERREYCLENLLNTNINITTDNDLELDCPIQSDFGNKGGEILRYINPEQPITHGEIIHIIKYDQLDEEINNKQNDIDSDQSELSS